MDTINLRKVYFLLLFVLTNSFHLYAQGEEAQKKRGAELFEAEDYAAALPIYSQLLSLYSKDPNYNYRFGTCMLFAEKDKEAPLKFLEFGTSKPSVEAEAHYYLGKAYHLNYRFSEAISAYKKYIELRHPNPKKRKNLPVEQQIKMCENGLKLLRNITDLAVIEKKSLSKDEFFRTYDLSDFGGKIIRKPDEFKLPADIEKGEESIIVLQKDANRLFFSSYGETGETGKDIFYVSKTEDGEWGNPESIEAPINTPNNEDYPFLHPDGVTLYFASDGHNSMGGYDIFKSNFDTQTGKWSSPQNIDFAISTPADDYLYITDLGGKNAYFASTRESVNDQVTVYRVKTERIPVDIALIRGSFISELTNAAKITIEDMNTGEIVGIFNTNSNNGDYLLNIPNGGKFNFLIEAENSSITHSGVVSLPKQKSLQPLKQEIQLLTSNGKETLKIINRFDEEVDDFELAADLLKQKAVLEVNAEIDPEPVIETEPVIEKEKTDTIQKDTILKEIHHLVIETKEEDISNEEIVAMAYTDAENLQKEATQLKKQSDIAYSIADNKNKEALLLSNKADSLLLINASEGKKLKHNSNELAQEAVIAYNLANRLSQQATLKQTETDKAYEIADKLEQVTNSDKTTAEAIAQIEELQQNIKNHS